ncbi:abortive infection system antitoxin AbiGi family protein [Emticicia agri]|uniref:Uncharacterized protein n=1 Tax=Emticicia agri TaxID=2492393 RepID=A0A4Q5LTM6_9BACT|nr:abortive infection system antitoxin AbiGi family protein [Emticicia agri]RYU92773.1 hypothetical protein EWM59_25385 [Emticicia agri]
MALSSNSIIHLTEEKESLIGILSDNFRIKYCKEQIKSPIGSIKAAVPMVSFCDIPLSQIKDHIEKYGKYGIGLTKEWAKRKRLNPILYIDDNSIIGEEFYKTFLKYIESKPQFVDVMLMDDRFYLDIIRYMKNYDGMLTRKGVTKYYRFSDEREWRYVPEHSHEFDPMLGFKYYNTEEQKNAENAKLKDLRLEFEPNDISYIFIKNDSEITDFVDLLSKVKRKYNYDDVNRLMTRIITTEQIFNDF